MNWLRNRLRAWLGAYTPPSGEDEVLLNQAVMAYELKELTGRFNAADKRLTSQRDLDYKCLAQRLEDHVNQLRTEINLGIGDLRARHYRNELALTAQGAKRKPVAKKATAKKKAKA